MKRLLVTIAALAVGAMLAPESANAQATRQDRQSGRSADRESGSTERGQQAGGEAKGDRAFMMKAAQDGQYEVQLGQLAQQKATNPQVKDLGRMLVDDHTKANQQLQQLAQSKQMQLSTAPSQRDASKLQRFQNLSGNEFDKAFVDEVIKGHQKDIASFERQTKRSGDQDIKTFAQNTLPVLRQHLQHAQQVQSSLGGGQSGQQQQQGQQGQQQQGGQTQQGGQQGQSGTQSPSGSR